MQFVAGQVHIDAPIEAVFARASDFAHAADFISAITRVEMLTPGPPGVGTRFRETRTMFGREATETMEVVEFESPRRYVLGATSCGSRFRSEMALAPRDGGTDLTLTVEVTPLTWFASVLGLLMRPMMKAMSKSCAKDLNDIKTAIEGPKAALA